MKRIFALLGFLLLVPTLAFANFPSITKGATSVIVPLAVLDSASTTGGRLASVAYNASPAPTCWYKREGATAQSITLVTATVGTWASGGWIYDSTAKQYELGIPDAAFVAGGNSRWVDVWCYGATNMLQVDLTIPLVDFGQYSTGTAQAVGTNTITLAASDTSGTNALGGAFQITIDSATTGGNQSLCACSNDATTKVVTMVTSWPVTITGAVKYSASPNAACRAVCVGVPAVNGNVTGNVAGSVASVTGAVASVSGNVGGNVVGTVASVTGNVGGNVTGSVGSLGATAKTDVNTEATSALTTYGPLKPTTAGRTLDVATTGEAGMDLSNVNGTLDAAEIGTAALSATKMGGDLANKIADHVLRRTTANAEASADGDTLNFRALLGSIEKMTHKVRVSGGNMNTYKSDDATIFRSQPMTTSSSAAPITGLD